MLSLVALTIVLCARQVVSLRIWKDWGSEVKGIPKDAQCTDDKVSSVHPWSDSKAFDPYGQCFVFRTSDPHL